MPDDLLTVDEAAKRLKVSKARVYHFIADGRLPAVRELVTVERIVGVRAADLAAVPRASHGGSRRRGVKLTGTLRDAPGGS